MSEDRIKDALCGHTCVCCMCQCGGHKRVDQHVLDLPSFMEKYRYSDSKDLNTKDQVKVHARKAKFILLANLLWALVCILTHTLRNEPGITNS